MKKQSERILSNTAEFLAFLKARLTLIHQSNLFFRDLHYGVMAFLQEHGMKMHYQPAEVVAREVAAAFEQQGTFKRIDHQSWLLNYPEFALPRVEKKAS